MSDSLVLRARRLIGAGVDSLTGRHETASPQGALPEAVLHEAVREIEQAAFDVRRELGHVTGQRQQAERLMEQAWEKLAELEARAKLAMDQRRDGLAGLAIRRQMDLEAHVPVLDAIKDELLVRQDELEGYVAALEARRLEMVADLAAAASACEAVASVTGLSGQDPGWRAASVAHESRIDQGFGFR